MSEVTQTCQMDVLIRYFDEDSKQVKVKYLDSCFFGHSTNVDLSEQFTNAVNEWNPNHMLQISMDGPNINECQWMAQVSSFYKTFKIIGK